MRDAGSSDANAAATKSASPVSVGAVGALPTALSTWAVISRRTPGVSGARYLLLAQPITGPA